MKALLQRVTKASVEVDKKVISQINNGLLVLLGISKNDNQKDVEYLAGKILDLRVFPGGKGQFDLSVRDINGEILVVSQFTLYSECQKGRRPDFINAAPGTVALPLYQDMLNALKKSGLNIQEGQFGADMKINLANDGPVTIMIESKNDLEKKALN
jgi:D-tyrosyl-tRNA(Tyr) deacylase